MRFVDRSGVVEPPSLTCHDGPGATELGRARTYYRAVPPPAKCYEFRAYKGDDVRAALRALFKGKCAYCETPYRTSQPVDVEHYRPKGGIVGAAGHPGYWWLAARWDNLLPSRIDCNRERHQITIRPGTSAAELEDAFRRGETAKAGKGDAFPTRNGWWARCETDDVRIEEPLLVDPTRTDPAVHIDWPVDPEISTALPIVDAAGNPSAEGVASISVYGLNRVGLVQERTFLLLDLRRREQRIVEMLDVAGDLTVGQEASKRIIQTALEMLRDIERMAAVEHRYSALVAAFVSRLREKLAAQA